PELLKAIAGLEKATAQVTRLDERLNVLAQLKAATLTSCEYCIDLGSQIARRSGLSDEQLLALPAYRTSPLFSDVEKLVLDYAVGMSRTPVDVPDGLVAKLRQHLDDGQLVELTDGMAPRNMHGGVASEVGVDARVVRDG